MTGGKKGCLSKSTPYISVIVSADLGGKETKEERGFIKQREKVSKTDSNIDKSGTLKVFTF